MKNKRLRKNVHLFLRVSEDQKELLNEAFKQYLSENDKLLTFAEFCRQQLMLQALKILRIVEMKKAAHDQNN